MTQTTSTNPSSDPINPIDQLMDDASQALAAGEYLNAAILCKQALLTARLADDYGRMSRICMPMLEAQRAIRQIALDTGSISFIQKSTDIPPEPSASCYLFAPNFIGADTLRFRLAANDAGIGVFALTREPTTSKGLWPIVGVAEFVVRVQVEPPKKKNDQLTIDWFSTTSETLGDKAIQDALNASDPDDPKQWIVDDFLDRLDACPEHEKFIKALSDACKDAMFAPPTNRTRRRGVINDPFSF